MDPESAPLLGKMPPTTTSRLVDAANRYLVGVALLMGVVIVRRRDTAAALSP
jgi:hypothetical protein